MWLRNILHLNKIAYLWKKDKASYLRDIQWQGRPFHIKCQILYNQRSLLCAKRGGDAGKYLRRHMSCPTGWAYSKMYWVSLQVFQQPCSRIALKPWCLISFHCQPSYFGKFFSVVFFFESEMWESLSSRPMNPCINLTEWDQLRRNTSWFFSACKNSVWVLLMPWYQTVTWILSWHKLGEVCWSQGNGAHLRVWV